MILTLKQAMDQGSTASDLRVLANSLERIARDGYAYEDAIGVCREPAYDRKAALDNAAALRRLAGELHRVKNTRVELSRSMFVNEHEFIKALGRVNPLNMTANETKAALAAGM